MTDHVTGASALLLGVLMIAAFLLAIGAARLLRDPAERRRGILMLVAALVMFGNVLIWTL